MPAVGDAVERHAAGEAEVLLLRDLVEVPGREQHHLLGHGLDRGGEVHLPLARAGSPARAAGRRRGAANFSPVIRELGGVGEVVHVQPERAVRLHVDELLLDDVGVYGLAVGREAHQLVLAGVDLEPGEVRERRVEQPERVGEADGLVEPDAVALADAPGRRRPLADAVGREDRGLLVGRGEEGARGVRLVVVGEDELALVRAAQPLADLRGGCGASRAARGGWRA